MSKKLQLTDEEKVNLWKQRFFEAQAGMEKFLVEKFGYEAIDEWIKHNAATFKDLQDDTSQGAADLALRFVKQAECYQSEYDIETLESEKASVTIFHCGIWDYRERAKQRGVKLTFDSPCTCYCTKLTKAMIEAKGYVASYQLTEVGPHHGCRWQIASQHVQEK